MVPKLYAYQEKVLVCFAHIDSYGVHYLCHLPISQLQHQWLSVLLSARMH